MVEKWACPCCKLAPSNVGKSIVCPKCGQECIPVEYLTDEEMNAQS